MPLLAAADERAVAAAQRGMAVYGMGVVHALGGDHAPGLVLGYAALTEAAIGGARRRGG